MLRNLIMNHWVGILMWFEIHTQRRHYKFLSISYGLNCEHCFRLKCFSIIAFPFSECFDRSEFCQSCYESWSWSSVGPNQGDAKLVCGGCRPGPQDFMFQFLLFENGFKNPRALHSVKFTRNQEHAADIRPQNTLLNDRWSSRFCEFCFKLWSFLFENSGT